MQIKYPEHALPGITNPIPEVIGTIITAGLILIVIFVVAVSVVRRISYKPINKDTDHNTYQ